MTNEAGKPTVWLGADPGVHGAIAVVNYPIFARVWSLSKLDPGGVFRLVQSIAKDHAVAFALVEKVGIRPGDERRAGIEKLIESFGVINAAILGNGIRMLEPIHPRSWQTRMSVAARRGDKGVALERAKSFFPDCKGLNLGTADAVLIARLCQWEAPDRGLAAEPNITRPRSWRKFKP